MVKKYEPYQKYYDYEQYPSLEMREAKSGEYVSLETYEHETKRLNAQIERQKEYIELLEDKMKQARDIFDFKLKSDPKKKGQIPKSKLKAINSQ